MQVRPKIRTHRPNTNLFPRTGRSTAAPKDRLQLIPSCPSSGRIPVAFWDFSVSWGHRKVGVQLRNTLRDPSSLSKRTIVEVERIKSETLESLAQRLVKEWIALIRAERSR